MLWTQSVKVVCKETIEYDLVLHAGWQRNMEMTSFGRGCVEVGARRPKCACFSSVESRLMDVFWPQFYWYPCVMCVGFAGVVLKDGSTGHSHFFGPRSLLDAPTQNFSSWLRCQSLNFRWAFSSYVQRLCFTLFPSMFGFLKNFPEECHMLWCILCSQWGQEARKL